MKKLKRLLIKAALAWFEARQAYANRHNNHRLGS
jgi:hypothetical protein